MSFVEIMLLIGVAGIFVAGLMVGSWTSGDRNRANYQTIPAEERPMRNAIARWSTFVAIVAFALAAVGYYLF
ncbi:hypothetical protein PA598K_05970 [Paenibacillus sp. 598K]|uniref:DUF5316 family protein n=1 Tax=Paenibacillus sp. 598K TaxID=1117987 RepID=UPI000FFA03C9|nr:DUF5316 family protein [Paenibacillus sp. 598K]GBF77418.1 hypothetical protein PA598K_05970 [Paenibacillus sp. 598K]